MEFNYQKLTSDNICLVENKQIAVDCRINELQESNINKILCLDASSKVDNYNISNGEVLVKGKINYRLVYSDSNCDVRSINYLCDFEEKILSEKLSATDKIFVDSEIVSVVSSGLDIIRLSAVVALKVYKVVSNSYDVVSNDNQDCYYKTEEIDKVDYVTTINAPFDIEDELSVNEEIKDILMLDSSVNLTDAICKENKINIMGEAVTNVTYKTETGIYKKCFNIDFSEEVEGASTEDSSCFTRLNLANSKVVLQDNDKKLKVKLSIDSCSIVLKKSKTLVVNDMYSMVSNLDVRKENAIIENFEYYRNFSERLLVEATLKDNLEGEIIGVICPKNKVLSIKNYEENMLVEGVVTACMLYKDGENIRSINIESPYNIQTENMQNVMLEGYVSEINAKQKTDNIVGLDMVLKFSAKTFSKMEIPIVVSAEETGENNCNNCAINIIVIDKPSSFFDVAKSLYTTPEELTRQNPNLAEPLTIGDKIYYYRKLVKKHEA